MDFRTKVKLDIRIVIHLGIQEPLALRKVNEMPVFVGHYITGFEAGKIIKLSLILTGDPAGFVKGHGVELY